MIVPLLLGLTLTSPDVKTGAPVARAFVWNKDGCNGANRTPRLTWDAPPPGTRSFNLTVIDHDAPKPGGWVHWTVSRIPANVRALSDVGPHGAMVGRNDFGTFGWGGPCPPPGPAHHYTFTLNAIDGHGRVVASPKLIPVYKR
jgi:Raf kinase inhibitor-like YbhB/YbcL family protein